MTTGCFRSLKSSAACRLGFPPEQFVDRIACGLVWIALIVLQGLISGCSGGSGSTTRQIPAPSNLVYPQSSISATVGTAVTTGTPTVTGTVSSYSISPALPAGLTISSSTGEISGTPTADSPQTSYTVTASNSTGSTTATVSITVVIAAPSNLVYPQTSILAIIGTAIATDTPTVKGTVSSYSISPALPAGLAMSSTTGAISGTPTATSPQTSYTVTASNSTGSTTATLSITVAIPAPSNLVYPQTSILANVGTAIATDTPTVTGTVSGYSIDPALPAGLAIDTTTGAISGTPAAAGPQTRYTVSASNSTGSTTAIVTITVAGGPYALLDAGHTTQIAAVRVTADRVLTLDDSGHWNLWDYATGQVVANGDGAAHGDIELAGNLAVVMDSSGSLQVFSAATGQMIFTLPYPGWSWFRLAIDGSYLCTGSPSGLTVWSPAGLQEFTRPGDYSQAQAFAAPEQVQVALGPAGLIVIETVAVPSGTSTISHPFNGFFRSWFIDGNRFLTSTANMWWVYSNATVQQSVMNLPSYLQLTGQGNWLWTPGLSIYSIGNTTPVATYNMDGKFAVPVGTGIALLTYDSSPAITLIDLSGASPADTTYNLPDQAYSPSAFGASSSSQWVVGTTGGVLLDGASVSTEPRYFGYGQIISIAGSSSNFAVATAIGKILLFGSAGNSQGTIGFLSGKLELSADGSVLAASAYLPSAFQLDMTLNLYSLPSQSILHTWPYTYNNSGTPYVWDYSLSGSGETVGQLLRGNAGGEASREITPASGSPVLWSDTGTDGPLVLSPDGVNFATASVEYPGTYTQPTTTFWSNGVLENAAIAFPEGWIDNTHLLAANYSTGPHGYSLYSGSTIYDPAGNPLTTLPASAFPEIFNPSFTSNGLVYDPASNTLYSLSTGAAVWTGPTPAPPPDVAGLGAVAGSNIVYLNGHQVFVAPY
jgi:hypothetical protein